MAYLDPPARFALPTRVRRWLGETGSVATPPSWQEAVYSQVGAFLFEHALDPTPDNYDLAFQFRAAANAQLVAAIRAELDRAGKLTTDAAERIFTESAGAVTPDSLSEVARRIDQQAQGLSQIARESGRDASEFRTVIEENAGRGDAAELLSVTGAMVARTRDAEARLRSAQTELGALRSTLAEAQRIADVDPLTELPNRRAFKRTLEAAIADARTAHAPLSLAFIDIDHFKRVNDLYGHETGDRVLRYVALLLARHFVDVGVVGRFGGEEFVVMIPRLLGEARALVDDCRRSLTDRHLYAATDGADLGSVTFSAGVTVMIGSDESTDLLRRADEALYRAKASGRDRVVIG